jgi:hypothetical protein
MFHVEHRFGSVGGPATRGAAPVSMVLGCTPLWAARGHSRLPIGDLRHETGVIAVSPSGDSAAGRGWFGRRHADPPVKSPEDEPRGACGAESRATQWIRRHSEP